MQLTATEVADNIIQSIIISLYICLSLNPKRKTLFTVLLWVLCTTGIYWVSSYIPVRWSIWLYIKGLLQQIAVLSFIFIMFEGTARKKLAAFFNMFVTLWAAEILMSILLQTLSSEGSIFQINKMSDGLVYCIRLYSPFGLSCALCVNLLIRSRRDYRRIGISFSVLALSFLSETVCVYALYKSKAYENIEAPGVFFLLFTPSAAAINYMTIYMHKFMCSMIQKENELLFEREKGLLQYQYYQTALENENKTRVIRHEIANQLQTMQILVGEGNEKQAREITSAMKNIYQSMRQLRFCGNDLINVILVSKQKDAMAKNVKLDVQISTLPEDIAIADADLSMVLNNLLDNAVDGASKASASGKKVIVKMAFKSGSLILKISNPTDMRDENFSDKRLKTSKTEKEYHGIGLELIRGIVKKYDGSMFVAVKDRLFTVKIVF